MSYVKLSHFNPAAITEIHFPHTVIESINYGRCFIWAYLCYSTFDNVELWTTDWHAFVKHNGKFYDSEVPNGIEDWKLLPTCARFCLMSPAHYYQQNAYSQTPHEFREFWREDQVCDYGYSSWDALERKAEIAKIQILERR
jgi:hypothetical protein